VELQVGLFKAWIAENGYSILKIHNAEEAGLKIHPSGLSQIPVLIVMIFCGIQISLQNQALMTKTWRCQKLKNLFRASLSRSLNERIESQRLCHLFS